MRLLSIMYKAITQFNVPTNLTIYISLRKYIAQCARIFMLLIQRYGKFDTNTKLRYSN